MDNRTFTSESVCAGHPDKICDQISDAILDEAIKKNRDSRVAIETLVTENFVVIAGEVTTKGEINYEKKAREVIRKLGYTDPELRFTSDSPIEIRVHTQSKEISLGVDKMGAGDQGMMFGYATDETKSFMPLPIMLAHELAKRIDEVREKKIILGLRPDGKTQVTIDYKNGRPHSVKTVVIAVPHHPKIGYQELKKEIYEKVVNYVLDNHGFKIKTTSLIFNGTGVWNISGPASDTGVTGRKIIVDTYGGMARVGGGAFSGKDPTKVDRSGAYAARFLAKNIVANSLAEKCEVRLAYFIGAKKPVMQEIETFGTAKKSEKIIKNFMNKILDTSVSGIIESLNLKRPIYFNTASYGHFGRDKFSWEKIVNL